MRFYKIDVGGGARVYESMVGGRTAPGALDVYIDVPVAPYATPVGGSIVRVWGIPLQHISQASDLNGKSIEVRGGMAKGLPLANPAQAGLLARGSVLAAFGNWIDVAMTLDLILAPPTGSPAKPANIVHNWRKGTQLSAAISSALSTAFPTLKPNVAISDKLVLQEDSVGFYQSLEQYAEVVRAISRKIIAGDAYQGVSIVPNGDRLDVYDGSKPATTRKIEFRDLIGQPTWIGLNEIQFKTAMRADVAVGDQVTLPPGALATTTSQSASQFRTRSAFQGTFTVQMVRHVGQYRQADAASWNTTFNAATAGTGS